MTPADDELAQAFDEAIAAAPPAAQGNGGGFDPMETARIIAAASKSVPPLKKQDLEMGLDDWAERLAGQTPEAITHSIAETIDLITPVCDDAGAEIKAALTRAGLLPPESPADRIYVDWSTFWDDEEQQEWAYKNILARGRGHAIYAVHKGGKSLLSLFMAADIATSGAGISCLYLDYEMTASDVRERLRDMGYGPETDFSHLHYALLPTLPALDTKEGGVALAALVDGITGSDPGRHVVVVIDTISRAVWGEENSADTWRLFYVHTGLRLKQRGVTWLRLDHGGKDSAKGQRGSSGKGDDVDVVWKLTPTEGGITLKRELSRMSWVPETVTLLMQDFPLCYLPAVFDWPEGTRVVANIMDRLEIPLDASVRTAGTKLREINEGRRHDVVSAALKWRRELAPGRRSEAGEHLGEHPSDQPPGPLPGNDREQSSFSLGNTSGNGGEQAPGVGGEQSPPIYRGTVHHSHFEPIEMDDMP